MMNLLATSRLTWTQEVLDLATCLTSCFFITTDRAQIGRTTSNDWTSYVHSANSWDVSDY